MIVTVTLNPAVDEECLVPEFRPGKWFRAGQVNRSPGGKGINVSYMLSQVDYPSVAMGFLAGFNGEYIRDALRRLHITTNFIHVPVRPFRTFTSSMKWGTLKPVLAESGPLHPRRGPRQVPLQLRKDAGSGPGSCMIGGSLRRVPRISTGTLDRKSQSKGIPPLSTRRTTALAAIRGGVRTFARVDHRFMAWVAGISLTSLDNLIEGVSRVHDYGVEWAVASYRNYGAVFFSPEGIFLAEYERKGLASLFASDDALVAGFMIAREEKMSTEDTIRFSTACAWENSLRVEKGFRGRSEIDQLATQVQVEKLD